MTQYLQLSSEEVPRLRELLAVFAAAFEDPASYSSAPPSDEYAARLLARDQHIVLVALADDVVVGGLVAYELCKFEQERSEVYIYDLAVAQSYRRQGIATGLIQTLAEIAGARGAYVVFVQADYGDEPAIALYSKLGKREDVLHFDLPVRLVPEGSK